MKIPSFSLKGFKHPQPVRDWFVVVTLSLVFLVGSVGWNVWLFERVVGGEVIGNPPAPLPAVFNQASLDEISKIINDRSREETKYRNGTYQFIDPSK